MPEFSEKENNIAFLTHDLKIHSNITNNNQTPTSSSSSSPKRSTSSPLVQSNRMNQVSPFRKKRQSLNISDSISPEDDHVPNILQEDYNALERQLTDSLLKYNTLQSENSRLQHELTSKSTEIESLQDKIKHVEERLNESLFENAKHEDVLHKQITMYKDMIDNLQVKIITLAEELEMNKKLQIDSAIHDQGEIMEKYHKLVRDYKILSSNFEVEKTSKSALIEQIELLLREKADLKSQIQATSRYADDLISQQDFNFNQPTHNVTHLSDDEFPTDYVGPQQQSNGISLMDDIIHSSPIKYDSSHESIQAEACFQFPPRSSSSTIQQQPIFESSMILDQFQTNQFPPSPDPNSKTKKRQSLPTPLKRMSHIEENEAFVLSPFKLHAPSSDFGERPRNSTPHLPLSSSKGHSKSGHTRYSSHDIIPIMVEFEKVDNGLRSTSMPESSVTRSQGATSDQKQMGTPELKKHRDEALSALNGFMESPDLSRTSETASSSKRSSYISDDKTRQEIMKLKFELQSLKLHNEKLLSYIGFELQKQKKNIKRLTKKQSQQSLLAVAAVSGSPSRKMEYSDAKLIESSRDILINKKRVLRSVSINAILGKNYNRYSDEANERSTHSTPTYIDQDRDRDIYDELYDIDDETELEGLEQEEKTLKKFASEVFSKRGLYSLSEDETDAEFEGEEEEDDEDIIDSTWQEETSQYSSDEEIGMFNQIRYLVMGNALYGGKKNKKKRDQHLVDDRLKFKFLTIALGIAIIAIKLTPPRTVTSST